MLQLYSTIACVPAGGDAYYCHEGVKIALDNVHK